VCRNEQVCSSATAIGEEGWLMLGHAAPQRSRVAVYGATGHTGRFVVAELLRRGFAPVCVARDQGKLAASRFRGHGVEGRAASIDEPAELDSAFAGTSAIINCAGPFVDTAEAVAAAALRAGIHYLDITAEQPSALAILDRFGDAARKAGIAVVPAMAFYGGLSDLLTTAATRGLEAVDEVRIGVALDSWHPTAGTRVTGARNTARRLKIIDGCLAPIPQPAPESTWDFPEPFGRQRVVELPFSEVALIAKHLQVARLSSFINADALRDLRDPKTPPPTTVDQQGRSAQNFLVEVTVRVGDERRRAAARGVDIYAVTAPLVCEAVDRVLGDTVREGGAFAPGELFDAEDFLRALSPQELRFEVVSSDRVTGPVKGNLGAS
jgi:short subunit dehydrogenase-like uncharacterized protein